MERQSGRKSESDRQKYNRLLEKYCFPGIMTVRFLSLFSLMLFFFSHAQAETPIVSTCRQGEEVSICFEVENFKANSVSFQLPDLPEGVNFITGVKESFYNETTDKEGTRLKLTFQFNRPGYVTIPPLKVKGGRKYLEFSFPSIQVLYNINQLTPEAFWSIKPNSILKTGKKITLLLQLRYVSSVDTYSVETPEKSILVLKKEFDFHENLNTDPERIITVAEYELTYFEDGEKTLPEAIIYAYSLNGMEIKILADQNIVDIKKSESRNENSSKKTNLFNLNYAFEDKNSDSDTVNLSKSEVTEKVKRIASLRSVEKKQLFPYKTIRERKLEELSLNIDYSENETSIWRIILSSVAVIGCIIGLIAAVLLKEDKLRVLFLTLLIIFSVFFGYALRTNFFEYGIFTGGDVKTIPEDSSTTFATLCGGQRIKINDKVSGWMFIEVDSNRKGWVHADDVYLIER